ncbi:MAG: beta-lactamase family protein [Anaerolineaceae bacterium]|nr:beta-lactamase family protein [Anaerolineaceae bacterium]
MTQITERVDQLFAEWDKPDSPGCALAVIKDGEIIYKRGYGMANLEHEIPIKPETIFDIGSTSKQFTALCILLLVRHGKLSLDDPIQKYLPEMPEYDNPISIRHLIYHTSGIRDYLGLMALANMTFENDYQEEEVVRLIASQKALNFKPGDEFLYSNSGYFLMSEIVQRVSGVNLREFAQKHIFGPLGMNNTHFHNDFKMIVKNRASAYSPKEGGGFEIDMGIFDVIGDGAVYTSVEDLYLWDQNFYDNKLDGGGQDLIDEMHVQSILNDGEKHEYALGLTISEYRGLKMVEHSGGWYGYRAQLVRFPEQRFSVICLANLGTIHPDVLSISVADIYLEDQFTEIKEDVLKPGEAEFIQVSDEELQQVVGFYQNEESGAIYEIVLQEDVLSFEAMGMSFLIKPISSEHFHSFETSSSIDIKIEKSLIHVFFSDGMFMETLKKMVKGTLSEEQLQEYSGNYYSKELGITYNLKVDENKLIMSPKLQYLSPLKPTIKDLFSAGMASFQFHRDIQDRIIGFGINAGRVKDIRFEKV